MTPILHSLLETDLYKFTMWQTMLHRHPQAQAEYRFVCRNTPAFPLAELLPEVDEQLDHLCSLVFTEDELAWLGGLRYIKGDFVDFLRIFRFQRRFVRASIAEDGQTLEIVADGPQVHVMAFEIHVLAIVNELYFRRSDQAAALAEGRDRLQAKIAALRAFAASEPARAHPFVFFDFGVRRRFSGAWQEEVVRTLKDEVPEFFKGTSNVHLARKFDLVAIGTMAHDNRELRGMDAHPRIDSSMDTKRAPRHRTCGETRFLWLSDFLVNMARQAHGGQLCCPRGARQHRGDGGQPAATAARGGRPQVEVRVPVPRGAREARTGRLSTGGRARGGSAGSDIFRASFSPRPLVAEFTA